MKKKFKLNKKSFKKPAYTLALLAWTVFACFAASYIVSYPMLWILGKLKYSLPIWTTIRTALVYILTAVLIIYVPKKIKKEWGTNLKKLGLNQSLTFTDIGLGFISFIATIIAAGIISSFLQALNLIDVSQPQDTGFENLYNPMDRVIGFVALVIFAPIAEEIIFRGWLYGKLKKYCKTVIAIVLTSILFGFMHGQWNVGITVGIMSAIMCVERELTGSIYAGIITHMLKNGIAFWYLYIVLGI